MPTVTICSLNVEWMNEWFTADADPVAFQADGHAGRTHEQHEGRRPERPD
jgi:hypothetical protein